MALVYELDSFLGQPLSRSSLVFLLKVSVELKKISLASMIVAMHLLLVSYNNLCRYVLQLRSAATCISVCGSGSLSLHVSLTCRTDTGLGPPPLNSLTFRPVVG